MSDQSMNVGQLIQRGNQLKRQGKLDEAIAIYRQAIEFNPHFAFSYYELGEALEKKGDITSAIIEYKKAINLNPNINFFHQHLQKLEASITHPNHSNFWTVGISMIKNEEDILEIFVRHNLHYLDYLVIADNSSTDNSRIILQKLMQEGLNLCVIDDHKMAYTQSEKITNLYRRVVTSFFPEFIVPIDADELIQSPSKQAFIHSLQAIPQPGVGLYPWKTYIPEPQTHPDFSSQFKYRRKKEQPEYFKIILRTGGCIDDQLKISQGSHGVLRKNGHLPNLKLSDIYLAHFPIRTVNQLLKKCLLGWLAYVEKNKRIDNKGQGYQKHNLYVKIMNGEKLSNEDLKDIALNYAQEVEMKQDGLDQLELKPPIIKSPRLSFSDLIAKEKDLTPVIRTIVKSWENQILNPPCLISREDLISFSQSSDIPSEYQNKNGVFKPNFHLEKLFVDIPPIQYIYERFLPKNVLDIGCGLGQYPRILNQLGVEEILGVDGFIPEKSFLKPSQYIRHDLTNILDLKRQFDLVLCLEVAEHLPSGKEVKLMKTLNTHAANILIFSAAELGQPGQGHINCKPFEYWANLLQEQGWVPQVTETLFLRCISSFSWFRRNPIVLQKQPSSTSEHDNLQSWDQLIAISRIPYNWYGQPPQIITEMLDVNLPNQIYPSVMNRSSEAGLAAQSAKM